MAYLQLHHHVSYGLVGERAVFLDLRRDRYLALDPATEEAFRGIRTADEPLLADAPARDLLLRTGLFRQGSLRGRLAPVSAAVPSASVLDRTAERRPGWTAPLRAWSAVSRARKRLASASLSGIVDAIRESRYAAAPSGDPAAAEEPARVFHAARTMVPIERRCLLDSLALLDWLSDEARHAMLVFGVRTDPFGAHCWLQTEHTLLTDAHDTIGSFVPVLSV
jgi:hypothetical protein